MPESQQEYSINVTINNNTDVALCTWSGLGAPFGSQLWNTAPAQPLGNLISGREYDFSFDLGGNQYAVR
jgi:hypothetical protein